VHGLIYLSLGEKSATIAADLLLGKGLPFGFLSVAVALQAELLLVLPELQLES
jgi:hypothetical protein